MSRGYLNLSLATMFGRLCRTVFNSVFTNPYTVSDVPVMDYVNNIPLQRSSDGLLVLYRMGNDCHCILSPLPNSQKTLRVFNISTEMDALSAFQSLSKQLQPFLQTGGRARSREVLQLILDTIRDHPDWTSAHVAATNGLTECFRHNALLSDVNTQVGSDGLTPLLLACQTGDLATVRELLGCGAKAEVGAANGETVFHYAVCSGNLPLLQVLMGIGRGVGLDVVSVAGETALHVACRLGREDVARDLILLGARRDICSSLGWPIHISLKNNQLGCMRVLLEEPGGLCLDGPADNTNNWLHCQLQAKDPKYSGTPLHWVKTAEAVRYLTERPSEVEARSRSGDTPLHVMVMRGRISCALALLAAGAEANAAGHHGDTPLHIAMRLDNLSLIKALMVFGAEIDQPNEIGETPGLLAARCSTGFEDFIAVSAVVGSLSRGFDTVDSAPKPRGARVLCLDGGGMRGLVLIQLLLAVEKAAGCPAKDLFDWIAGTSTGAILALGIAREKSLVYLRALYFRMKDLVFQGSRPYDSAPLDRFLREEFGENTHMTDIQTPRVLLTGVLADRHPAELHLFRNYDPPNTGHEPHYCPLTPFKPVTQPSDQLIWMAARSSGAAPTYFRQMGRFLDGGLLANNPTLDALTEIHEVNKALRVEGKMDLVVPPAIVLSLGTGKPPQEKVCGVDVYRPTGPIDVVRTVFGARELGRMLVDCCTESEARMVDRARAWCEMISVDYHRLSPQLTADVMLDEVQDAMLIDMLWDTQMYIYKQKDNIKRIAESLLRYAPP
uniref:85/88 kDa calcium-independent phospholipase A2 isoform X3 n=1 Tax=Myxine glutinosa TaxID=7769 RepID=UPI00358E67F7